MVAEPKSAELSCLLALMRMRSILDEFSILTPERAFYAFAVRFSPLQ